MQHCTAGLQVSAVARVGCRGGLVCIVRFGNVNVCYCLMKINREISVFQGHQILPLLIVAAYQTPYVLV